VKKNFVASHQKLIEGTLLTFVVAGSFAAICAVASPALTLFGTQFAFGAPDNIFFALIGAGLSMLPFVPYLLFLGGVSALLSANIFPDKENKTFLRIWGVILLGLMLIFIKYYFSF